jgi:hypothetical protein
LKKQQAKKGRNLYPEMDSTGKTYSGVDQWARAYNKATGRPTKTSKDHINFYQSKKSGKIKHKMTKSALLRMQAAERKRKQALQKKVRIEE